MFNHRISSCVRPVVFCFSFTLVVLVLISRPTWVYAQKDSDFLLDTMTTELNRSMSKLAQAQAAPMYYLQYTVTEEKIHMLNMTDGAFEAPFDSVRRYLDVDLRVGSEELDNTHEIREGNWQDSFLPHRSILFPLSGDEKALRAVLWQETEYQYLKAQQRLTKVLTNRNIKVDEEDRSADFSYAVPEKDEQGQPSDARFDRKAWENIFKKVAVYLSQFPYIYNSKIWLSVNNQTQSLVSSDGHRLKMFSPNVSFGIYLYGMAADGMELIRQDSMMFKDVEHMPDEADILKVAQRLAKELKELIDAPLIEPYSGPAILLNRSSGVFFHEIFGHRIEGHRQKSESEGQTFTKKVGQSIMPEFINIYDDPTVKMFQNRDLAGYYAYDDEGSKAQKVTLVKKGVLKNFLMSRSPIKDFNATNGHGRRQRGYPVVARQGNLLITADAQDQTMPYEKLRARLIEECKKANKPFGLIFDDISGGETMTQRYNPQAFKVIPLYVHKIFVDGRPDQVVRGVNIVGTPMSALSKIIAVGNDPAIFNGVCGAESGWVPVSAVSPSILLSEIEVEKSYKQQTKPPILAPPQ